MAPPGVMCLALDAEQNCSRFQYPAHGKCCSRCPPGQRVREPCSTGEGSDTICGPCQPRHFQDSWTKEPVCTPHTYCDQNAGLDVHTQGNATQDTVCRCQNGTHCSSTECQSCRENSVCGPGEGVKQTATDATDTVCTECPVGFFSDVSSAVAPCQPWSSCEASGLIHKDGGTRLSDVTCGEAQRAHSPAVLPAALAALILVLGGIGLLLWCRCRHHKALPKGHQNEPAEDEDEEACPPALPVQETLLTAHEDGKDSRLAEQESA
ncbi:tumor necrosis factor receptor superfamily member 5 isoform X2 [Sphaerodactylus townsendi]|uniref:tumor necrosis factor receptor superfamily member 5 isoform X2 n=1 Tax=Sphaerodactylus townsendi TaxID=933632 RepID=UPI002025C813|nr:tumor necrosis factor receptor superfamily member 5 isoform X2 [Sphaerodactylus townsendi]